MADGIRKRGRMWYGRWTDEYGNPCERALSPDRREAVRLRNEAVTRVRRIKLGLEDSGAPASATPLSEVVDEWHRSMRSRVTPKHASDARRGALRVIRLLRVRRVHEIDGPGLNRAMVALVGEGASNRTANKEIGYLRTFLKWAKRAGHLARVPDLDLDPLPTDGRYARRVRRKLSRAELDRLLAASRGDSAEVLLALVAGTGLRLGEALRASWGHLRDRRLRVPASHAKSHTERTVALPQWLAGVLATERERQRAILRRAPKPDDPIARNRRESRWGAVGAHRAFVRIRERAGFPARFPDGTELGWHALRHTFATMMADAGASQSALQAQLGWKSGRMAQVYVDLARVSTGHIVDAMPVPEYGQGAGKDGHRAHKRKGRNG